MLTQWACRWTPEGDYSRSFFQNQVIRIRSNSRKPNTTPTTEYNSPTTSIQVSGSSRLVTQWSSPGLCADRAVFRRSHALADFSADSKAFSVLHLCQPRWRTPLQNPSNGEPGRLQRFSEDRESPYLFTQPWERPLVMSWAVVFSRHPTSGSSDCLCVRDYIMPADTIQRGNVAYRNDADISG